MYICRECEKTRMEHARGVARSFGQCEICEKTADCLDARDYKAKPRDETAFETAWRLGRDIMSPPDRNR